MFNVTKTKIKNLNKTYFIYIIKCDNNILYTGITTDYKRRFDEHNKVKGSNKGAKFTKSHRPNCIVALWKTNNRSNALRLEIRITQLQKMDKQKLIDDNFNFKLFFKGLVDCRMYRRVNI